MEEGTLTFKTNGHEEDSSSVSSSVIDGALREAEARKAHESDMTDEIALPDDSTPHLIAHRLSGSEAYPHAQVSQAGNHVTTISVGGSEEIHSAGPRREEDLRMSLRMDEEITLGDDIVYVEPRTGEPSSPTSPISPSRRSRQASESSSLHSEPNFGFGEGNVLTDEDIRR